MDNNVLRWSPNTVSPGGKKGLKVEGKAWKEIRGGAQKVIKVEAWKESQDKAQERIEGKVQKQIEGDAQKRETTAEYRGYLLVYIPTSVCEGHKTEKLITCPLLPWWWAKPAHLTDRR